TKHNCLVKNIADLPRIMHEAFYVARSGRPGPVVVDLPKDIQQAKGVYTNHATGKHRSYNPQLKADPKRLEEAIELMANAKRPLFYCGGGVINSGPPASQLLAPFVRLTGFPRTPPPVGPRALPASDSQFIGMLRQPWALQS